MALCLLTLSQSVGWAPTDRRPLSAVCLHVAVLSLLFIIHCRSLAQLPLWTFSVPLFVSMRVQLSQRCTKVDSGFNSARANILRTTEWQRIKTGVCVWLYALVHFHLQFNCAQSVCISASTCRDTRFTKSKMLAPLKSKYMHFYVKKYKFLSFFTSRAKSSIINLCYIRAGHTN